MAIVLLFCSTLVQPLFQDEFLRRNLLSSSPAAQQQFNTEDPRASEPDFEETDSELDASDGEEWMVASDDDDMLVASDSDRAQCQLGRARRAYASRRPDGFMFLGKPVCLKAYCRLLSVGQKVLQRLRSGQLGYTSNRAQAPKHPTFGFSLRGDAAEKWPSVLMFLWIIYHSSAEFMPEGGHSLRKPTVEQFDGSEAPFKLAEDRDKESVDRRVNEFMNGLHQYRSDIDLHLVGPGSFKGERRELQ